MTMRAVTFEAVLTLINAYDKLQSDRLNDNEQLVQALWSSPAHGWRTNRTRSMITAMLSEKAGRRGKRSGRISCCTCPIRTLWLHISPSRQTATRPIFCARRSRDDIHKFSMIPDLTDENFAANASGVAMKYKLFGLEQLGHGQGTLVQRRRCMSAF